MLIAGFQPMTLLDYPGKIAAIIFTQGCNFACSYCHNPEMIPSKRVLPANPNLGMKDILRLLLTRKGLLDGVVISGGEPTLQKTLPKVIKHIKSMGFLLKLDTNGSNPEMLKDLIENRLLDFIAMDVKHSPKKYQQLVKNNCAALIQQSITLIMKSGIDYEFRSTIVPGIHDASDIHSMGRMIKGAKKWALQNFRSLKTLDKKLRNQRSFHEEELEKFALIASKYAKEVGVRNPFSVFPSESQ